MAKRITMHGASDEDVTRLRDLLGGNAGNLQSNWKIYSGNETDLVVIDVDTVYGHMDWLRAHSTGRPVAVLTEHAQFSDADLVLHKPLDAANLVDVLNRADPLIADRPDWTSDDVPAPPPVPSRAAAAAPRPVVAPPPPPAPPAPPRERRLADWLADGALQSAVRLQDASAPELIVDPSAKTFYAEGNARSLAPYCARVIAPSEWQEVSAADAAKLQETGKTQPASRLLWLAHALGSNGQICAGLDVNAKYKLARWPQIEREFPKHFRIATVMLKQYATLTEIAEQSGATLPDVVDFTNAYNATGYVESEAVARAAEAPQRDSGRHAILSRLRNPFGGS